MADFYLSRRFLRRLLPIRLAREGTYLAFMAENASAFKSTPSTSRCPSRKDQQRLGDNLRHHAKIGVVTGACICVAAGSVYRRPFSQCSDRGALVP
jgi:hypothetical protein